MGYETKLIFVEKYDCNYCMTIAMVDMCKLGYDTSTGKLIQELKDANKTKYSKKTLKLMEKVNEYQREEDDMIESVYSADSVPSVLEPGHGHELFELEHQLQEHMPYFAGFDGDRYYYSDKYDDPLLITDLRTLKKHLERDKKHEPYRRYDLAIGLINNFLDNDEWDEEKIRVILWGY